MVWLDPQPLPEQIWKLYQAYYTHESVDGGLRAYETRGLNKIIKRALSLAFLWRAPLYRTDFLYLEGMKPGRLLEVGCGNGSFLRAAAALGWQCEGLDFDEDAVRQVNSVPGVRAYVGQLVDARYPAGSVDAIVMNNVVEHLWNPVETLAKCREFLRPAGRLILVTPNISSIGHRIFGRYWRGLEPPRHLFLFNPGAIEAMCRGADFDGVLVGTSAGGSHCRAMFEISNEIAVKAGLPPLLTTGKMGRIATLECVTTMLGGQHGEWLVAIANRRE
jgi:2-polyprenyl-3-methyl-5-hydroxy-6-metoxy-1,4-benzoquinol methylase